MKEKLTLSTAKKLQRLKNGEVIAYSRVKNHVVDSLIAEHILWKKGKHRQTVQLQNTAALDSYLANQMQINSLEEFITTLDNENRVRADLVTVTGNSKYQAQRTFQGFLVNSYAAIETRLNGEPLTIHPKKGTFTFIYDYNDFCIDKSVTVVGMENAENFRYIEQQKGLFSAINPLFVSRYPQSQHKDFIRWISRLENPYWHFGDFDMSGIAIYLNEYKKHLGDRATFFIPPTITIDLPKWGSSERYDKQSVNFNPEKITESNLYDLFLLIQKYQKGLDQEFYIRKRLTTGSNNG